MYVYAVYCMSTLYELAVVPGTAEAALHCVCTQFVLYQYL